jgi:hypothetical protein
MVFNSPNPISMQGYLKMGWSLAGRLPIYVGMEACFHVLIILKRSMDFIRNIAVETALQNLARIGRYQLLMLFYTRRLATRI